MSGQLLKAINFKVDLVKSTVTIYLTDLRYKLLPLSKNEAIVQYNTIIDRDNNATNAKRKDPRDEARISGIALASKQQDEKTNRQIKRELEQRDRRFLFISDTVNALLESNLGKELRRRISIYNKIKRK